MDFLENLQAYLDEVGKGPVPEQPLTAPRLKFVREAFVGVAEEVESQPWSSRVRKEDVAAWQETDAAPRFAGRFDELLEQSIWSGAGATKRKTLLRDALRLRFGRATLIGSPVETRELERLVTISSRGLPHVASRTRLDRYVAETRLATPDALLPPATVFLSLRGRDAIRWLLRVEAVQSTGPFDDWRVGPAMARELLDALPRWFAVDDEEPSPFSWPSLHRLEGLGLLKREEHPAGDAWHVEVTATGRELLKELVDDRASSFGVLAASMLSDLSHAALRATPLDKAVRADETAALVRQMRMITHELRNTLVPAQVSLALMKPKLGALATAEPLSVVEKGLDRALQFVDELSVVRAAVPEQEPVDVVAAVRSALAEVDLLANLSTTLEAAAVPTVSADRGRLVRAFVNLLRNAAQSRDSAPVSVRVRVRSLDQGGTVEVAVEDDGPGIAPEHWPALFQEGFSARKGGTGLGLAFVREVAREAGGDVEHSPVPSGGARFTVRLPAIGGRGTR